MSENRNITQIAIVDLGELKDLKDYIHDAYIQSLGRTQPNEEQFNRIYTNIFIANRMIEDIIGDLNDNSSENW